MVSTTFTHPHGSSVKSADNVEKIPSVTLLTTPTNASATRLRSSDGGVPGQLTRPQEDMFGKSSSEEVQQSVAQTVLYNTRTTTTTSTSDGSGYDGDDESGTSSCSLQQYIRPYQIPINTERCGLPWTTLSSEQHTVYTTPTNTYNYVEDLKIPQKQNGNRMVLEPKFVDYGSIHPTTDVPQLQQHNSSHALLSPRSVLSLPPLDDEELPNTSHGTKMTQGDLYQRQPLLPNPGKSDKWGHNAHDSSDKDYYEEDKSSDRNGVIKIDMPPPVREEPRFPQERWKTLLAAIIMFFNFILTLTSLSLVHERVPDRKKYDPLPDVFLDNVRAIDGALNISEYIIIVCVNTSMIAMVFHKHRFIVFRRIFLIMSLLYMYRAITMFVTVLPISSRTYPCSPKSNETTPLMIAKRVIKLMSGFGLSVNGQHTYCGDFIYSGHTVVLVFSSLIVSEYTPKKFYLIHWLYWILGIVGVVMLELSHGHYTVDVIIAYYITTRIFWTYHTLANNPNLKQYSPNNLLGREWWFSIFLYFEGNVGAPLPRQYDWPLPWPRRFHKKSRAS